MQHALFNHPNFGQYDGVLVGKTFGVISSTGPTGIADPRVLQCALQHRFQLYRQHRPHVANVFTRRAGA